MVDYRHFIPLRHRGEELFRAISDTAVRKVSRPQSWCHRPFSTFCSEFISVNLFVGEVPYQRIFIRVLFEMDSPEAEAKEAQCKFQGLCASECRPSAAIGTH